MDTLVITIRDTSVAQQARPEDFSIYTAFVVDLGFALLRADGSEATVPVQVVVSAEEYRAVDTVEALIVERALENYVIVLPMWNRGPLPVSPAVIVRGGGFRTG